LKVWISAWLLVSAQPLTSTEIAAKTIAVFTFIVLHCTALTIFLLLSRLTGTPSLTEIHCLIICIASRLDGKTVSFPVILKQRPLE
jgi:hypothetical protein